MKRVSMVLVLSALMLTALPTSPVMAQDGRSYLPVIAPRGSAVTSLGTELSAMLRDRHGRYWFVSNGNGVYRRDGASLVRFTVRDGLLSDFILSVQEDVRGDLWFGTREGLCRYNGLTFSDYSDTVARAPRGTIRYRSGGLFFPHRDGVCYYDGTSFTNIVYHADTLRHRYGTMARPFSVYSTVVDRSGIVWFGTQEKGVCRFNGTTYTYLTEKGLAGPAVRTVFQDSRGTMWFGNNGRGLFRYDGKRLVNVTDEKGLENPEYLKTGRLDGPPGTLSRVWAVNEDDDGVLWIGTIDNGLWKYDGTTLTNYTVKEGLPGNAVWSIYKDRGGVLWFITNGNAVSRFNGRTFVPFPN
ncbi:MAG: hypothetical protein F9K22_08285 [Bacteroidetes bacterium]|nr:MAG: hypothetical protein F9K22_08285 [Bacteroidota bacterium]